MPSFDYEGLSLGDTAAVVAYLRSAAPVQTPSKEPQIGPAAKVLSALGQMPVLFPAKMISMAREFGAKPEEAVTLAFGQYLAHSCVGCHGSEFRGGKIPGGDPSWPEASNIRLAGRSAWSEASFLQMMKTGQSPETGKALRAPMPVHLLKQMNETESRALWLFLSSLRDTSV